MPVYNIYRQSFQLEKTFVSGWPPSSCHLRNFCFRLATERLFPNVLRETSMILPLPNRKGHFHRNQTMSSFLDKKQECPQKPKERGVYYEPTG